MFQKKPSASEVDGVQYRRAKLWQIICYLIEAVGLLCMFNLCSSKGFGLPVFALTYIIYIIGYTVTNMTAQTLPAILPKCGGTFNQDFLSTVCTIVLIIAGIGTLIVCAGISPSISPKTSRASTKSTSR